MVFESFRGERCKEACLVFKAVCLLKVPMITYTWVL